MSFPSGNEIFKFPEFAFCTYVFSTKYFIMRVVNHQPLALTLTASDKRLSKWVSPFGNPRVEACWRLVAAYRSLLRPSSPAIAKASTEHPYHA